ncbi:unnamed protein product [Nippostrongylus brasiliensis]|uniref:C-type lectin domain-containing protein n=1 Tax=Nippostrongylus brasiliensis TaxID=27835 RepID=A0A0N4Y101_NIPBR|nr:unnamed protein product [Nippostrongylus brasiliensis]
MIPRIIIVLCLVGSFVDSYPHDTYNHCPHGWTLIGESCYYFENTAMRFEVAELMCIEKQSFIFVPTSVNEWEEVMARSKMNVLTWIGLKQVDDLREPLWKRPGGISVDKLNWVNPIPLYSEHNGWSVSTECAAHFNSVAVRHVFFYHCDSMLYSICKKRPTTLPKKKGSYNEKF